MSSDDMHRYDHPPCTLCGEPIARGHTRLHTGQIFHHECADRYRDTDIEQ